jgi:Leishmanolysin
VETSEQSNTRTCTIVTMRFTMKLEVYLFVVTIFACFSLTSADVSDFTEQQKSRQLQNAGTIITINIINSVTNQVIGQLVDRATININQYGLTSASQLNFEFVTNGTANFVRFRVTGNSSFVFATNRKPFALCGSSTGRDFYSCEKLTIGQSTIYAQPSSRTSAGKIRGVAKTITFSISQTDLKVSPKTAPVRSPVSPVRSPTLPVRSPVIAPVNSSPISAFNITFSITGKSPDLTLSDREVFQNAGKRWSEVIVGDLPSQSSAGLSLQPGCTAPSTIDDLHICGDVSYIDGEYGVLGWAGISHLRSGTSMPLVGNMGFDSGDMPRLRQGNLLYSVILHEVGHILGIGTLWTNKGLTGKDADNCPYFGKFGNEEYRALSGCTGSVPIEQTGGAGTRCGHFSESCFKDELMTGWRSGTMPISRLTIASLRDTGYTVNYAKADAYSSSNMNPTCVCKRRELNLREGAANSTNSTAWTRRQLSGNGYRNALKFGKTILMQQRRRFISKKRSGNTIASEGAVADTSDFISVIYDDGINGIFSILVHQDDL